MLKKKSDIFCIVKGMDVSINDSQEIVHLIRLGKGIVILSAVLHNIHKQSIESSEFSARYLICFHTVIVFRLQHISQC
jgi:hypothetical protein